MTVTITSDYRCGCAACNARTEFVEEVLLKTPHGDKSRMLVAVGCIDRIRPWQAVVDDMDFAHWGRCYLLVFKASPENEPDNPNRFIWRLTNHAFVCHDAGRAASLEAGRALAARSLVREVLKQWHPKEAENEDSG